MDGQRAGYLERAERYAGYTLPRACPPDNYDSNRDALQNDWQAVGAQCVNHVTNKLMLTMFAPSRPFIRLELAPAELAKLKQLMGQDLDLDGMLAAKEQEAAKELDTRGARPQLHEALTNLVIIGDTLAHLGDDSIEVYGIRDYVVERTPRGAMSNAVVREPYCVRDLTDAAVAAIKTKRPGVKEDDTVTQYRWLRRDGDTITMTVWIDDVRLPPEFEDSWPVDECPWKFWSWNLRRKQHYGTGLVEEYHGDFAALSILSKAQLDAAILASEFRWLVNPAGSTNADDLEQSENGAVLAGTPEDIGIVTSNKGGDLQVIRTIAEDYIRRLGRGFLLGSAMTRDAERVTAVELSMQAQELETGLGGAYSRLASGPQRDVGFWLLEKVQLEIRETKIRMAVITGLDALSRNGDLAALRGALQDVAGLSTLGEAAGTLKMNAIIATIFLGHGLNPQKYVNSPEEQQAIDAARRQAEVSDQSAVAGAQAGAQVAARQQVQAQ